MYNRPAPVPDLTSSPDRNAFCTHRRARRRDRLVNVGVAAAAAECGAAKGWHRDDRAASGQPKQAAYARSAKVRPLHARLGSSSASSPGFNGGAGSPGCWIPARPRSVRSRADALHETRRSRSPSSTKTAAFSPERPRGGIGRADAISRHSSCCRYRRWEYWRRTGLIVESSASTSSDPRISLRLIRAICNRPIRLPSMIAPPRSGWPKLLDRGVQSRARFP